VLLWEETLARSFVDMVGIHSDYIDHKLRKQVYQMKCSREPCEIPESHAISKVDVVSHGVRSECVV
jgi:hypothetical protein